MSAARLYDRLGSCLLDDESQVPVAGEVDGQLDMLDRRRVDDIDGIPSLGAVSEGVSHRQAGIALGPVCPDRYGIIRVEPRAAGGREEEAALRCIVALRPGVARSPRRGGLQQDAPKRPVEPGPFVPRRPLRVPGPDLALGPRVHGVCSRRVAKRNVAVADCLIHSKLRPLPVEVGGQRGRG